MNNPGDIEIPYISPETHEIHPTLVDVAKFIQVLSCDYNKPSDEEAELLSWELFRFLSIRAVYGKDAIPDGPLEVVWKGVMLETRLYRDICKVVLDEIYGTDCDSRDLDGIVSDDIIIYSLNDKLKDKIRKMKYINTLNKYLRIYGEPLYPIYWSDYYMAMGYSSRIGSNFPVLERGSKHIPLKIARFLPSGYRGEMLKIIVDVDIHPVVIDFPTNQSILNFKKYLGIPEDTILILNNRVILSNERLLYDYKITNGDTFSLQNPHNAYLFTEEYQKIMLEQLSKGQNKLLWEQFSKKFQ